MQGKSVFSVLFIVAHLKSNKNEKPTPPPKSKVFGGGQDGVPVILHLIVSIAFPLHLPA
jgi:hypothetical protein